MSNNRIEFDQKINDAVMRLAFETGRKARTQKQLTEVRMDLIWRAVGNPPTDEDMRADKRAAEALRENSQDPAGALEDIASGIGTKL